jgi:hypothetical protein
VSTGAENWLVQRTEEITSAVSYRTESGSWVTEKDEAGHFEEDYAKTLVRTLKTAELQEPKQAFEYDRILA